MSWTLDVVAASGRQDKGGSAFVVFEVRCATDAGSAWSVFRRYAQFAALHKELAVAATPYPGVAVPTLPKRRLLGSSVEPAFVERRRGALAVRWARAVARTTAAVRRHRTTTDPREDRP